MNTSSISNRVPSLDLARILAMLMMIAGHTFFSLIEPSQINTNASPWNWWEFLRGATAPIFLTVSGIVQVFANKRDEFGKLKKATVRKRALMALMLISIGYLLVFPAERIFDLPYLDPKYFQNFFAVNVLQLIGVSLLMVLLTFVLTRSDKSLFYVSLSIAILMTIATPFVNKVNWFEILPYPIASFLDYRNGSIFTIFPFSAYLFYGMAFGIKLKQVEPMRRIDFIIKVSLILTPILYLLGYYVFKIEWDFIKDTPIPYKASAGYIFTRFFIVTIVLALTGFITKKLLHLQDYFSFFGQKALYVYVLHFFVLYGTAMTPGVHQFYGGASSIALAFANIPIVILGTLLLTFLINQIIANNSKYALAYKFSISVYLVYVLFI
jgi:uncharacterized membrane protein